MYHNFHKTLLSANTALLIEQFYFSAPSRCMVTLCRVCWSYTSVNTKLCYQSNEDIVQTFYDNTTNTVNHNSTKSHMPSYCSRVCHLSFGQATLTHSFPGPCLDNDLREIKRSETAQLTLNFIHNTVYTVSTQDLRTRNARNSSKSCCYRE